MRLKSFLFKATIQIVFLVPALVFGADQTQQQESAEQHKLSDYLGITGTAPVNQTVSSAGAAFEFLPIGINFYGFFSQTLSNNIYYEARLYSRYNYQTVNPAVPGLPAPTGPLPMGYGVTGIIGYNFRPNNAIDITPYLRLNAYNNMGPVYDDTTGDYLNSTTYAALFGGKFVFKVNPIFAPYINIWGGYQRNDLVGAYPNSATNSNTPISGVLNQFAVTYEIGLGAKLTNHIYLIPYIGYSTLFNYPDQSAQTAIDQGGLNQTGAPGTLQYFGLKLSAAW